MVNGGAGADILSGAKGTLWEDAVTREEKEQAVDSVLARYEHLGAAVVSDDQTLCRLLKTLGFSDADGDVGEYLCSFLSPDGAARARRRWQVAADGREMLSRRVAPRAGSAREHLLERARELASPLRAGHLRSSSSASASEIRAR